METNVRELSSVRSASEPDSRINRLMRLIGGSQTRINSERIAEASRDDLLLAVRALSETINDIRFGGEKEDRHYQWMPLADTSVRVEIIYEAPEAATRDFPGDPGELTIKRVLINGVWCDPFDALGEQKVMDWEYELWEQVKRGDDDY